MAVRKEELVENVEGARIYSFPVPRSARRRRRFAIRRLVAGAGVAVVVWGAVVGLRGTGGGGGEAGARSRKGVPVAVVVGQGETLWDLAGRYARPGGDPREYVAAVAELNRLRGRTAQAGMRLRLPR